MPVNSIVGQKSIDRSISSVISGASGVFRLSSFEDIFNFHSGFAVGHKCPETLLDC